MPSITTWTRLEPRSREDDIEAGLQARVHDPLWLLGRQWQFNEFKGEDAGSPVTVELRGEIFRLTRYHLGPLPAGGRAAGKPYASEEVPLETLVEREPVSVLGVATLRFAADAGRHFARLLAAGGVGRYRGAYLRHYALQTPPFVERQTYDDQSLRFLAVLAGRVIDGLQLYQAIRQNPRPTDRLPGLPPDPLVPSADRERTIAAAAAWMQWYERFAAEPAGDEAAWIPERMEYEFTVAAAAPDGEIVLSAPEYSEGHPDWYSFVRRPNASLGAPPGEARREEIRQTTIPAPVSYPGMPASRWWQFEDAQVDFGAVDAGPDDLVRLLLVEFALIYGNDWFVIPVDVPVGSLCRIASLAVIDSFGGETAVPAFRQAGGAGAQWRMFTLASDRSSTFARSQPDFLFLPPALATSLHGPPLDEVLFARDEMANMAWAIECIVEGRAGEPFDCRDEAHARARSEAGPSPSGGADALRYRLATKVPRYWIPLVPVPLDDRGAIRLQRGALAQGDSLARARSRILATDGPLSLRDEEVPRAGARVIRAYQYARWIDGSARLWIGRRKEVGRGPGSSGLRFDTVEP